ncbi:hypothetical protein L9F63_018554 [Diploptera punctata]|uniref:Uncharacterized protein n=1 Tax=Diploptera punctata TaxID=6984 RepID=A0AAD7ZX90_DIPPU|nr:hypothetical protein L9F63_018554 [Diploptera punctata]
MLTNSPRQVGHSFRDGLQVLQMLCPFIHIVIGANIISKQTGHSSIFRRSSFSLSMVI